MSGTLEFMLTFGDPWGSGVGSALCADLWGFTGKQGARRVDAVLLRTAWTHVPVFTCCVHMSVAGRRGAVEE